MKHLSTAELSAHLDGALGERARADADRHLATCEACRHALADLAAQDHRLSSLLTHDPGEAYFETFADRVTERIASDRPAIHPADEPRGAFSWFRSPRGLALAGGVAAVIVGAGVVLLTARQPLDAVRDPEIAQRSEQVAPEAPNRLESPAAPEASSRLDESDSRVAAPPSEARRETESRTQAQEDLAASRPSAGEAGRTTAPTSNRMADGATKAAALQRARKVGTPGEAQQRFAQPPRPSEAPGTLTKPTAQPLSEKTAAERREAKAPPPPPATIESTSPARGGRSSDVQTLRSSEETAFSPAYERGRLCGRVTDASGRPVARASVAAADLGVTATTGADGRYCLDLAAGERTIVVMAVGFEPARRAITVTSGTTDADVTLRAVEVLPGVGSASRRMLDTLAGWPERARGPARTALAAMERARRTRSAATWDDAAADWERAVARAGGGAHETFAREHLAEARYQAWLLQPTPARTGAAIGSLTAFIARAPLGAAREEAARRLDRVRR